MPVIGTMVLSMVIVIFVLQESSNETRLEPLKKHYCVEFEMYNGTRPLRQQSTDCFFTEKEMEDFMDACSLGKLGEGVCYPMYKGAYMVNDNDCIRSNSLSLVCWTIVEKIIP